MDSLTSFDNDELLALSDYDFQNDRHQDALVKLKVLIARNQTPLPTYALLGRIYATIGLLERAREAINFYLSRAPKEQTLNEIFQLGLVESDLGNFDIALQIWSDLLIEHPNHCPALFHKANVLIKKGQVQEAVDLLNHILETAPEGDKYIPMADRLLSRIVLQ